VLVVWMGRGGSSERDSGSLGSPPHPFAAYCWLSIIFPSYELSASGGVGERASHRVLNALHGTGTDAKLSSDFQDALAGL